MTFETSAEEAAILAIPDGARAIDVENTRRFTAYAKANLENWYRYANGPRGREAQNGDLRLIIGCDKTTSYGMVAASNMSRERTNYLKLSTATPHYRWEYSGLAESRVGPDPREVEELRAGDISNDAVDGKYRNLCVFVRAVNPMLPDKLFDAIKLEIDAEDEFQVAQKQQEIHRQVLDTFNFPGQTLIG